MLEFIRSVVIPLRWLHILTAAAWFGEVVVINLVLIPALKRAAIIERDFVLLGVFPGIFRLASVLSAVVVSSGTLLTYALLDGQWSRLLTSGVWGHSILLGGTLAWSITFFHFFVEGWVSKRLGYDETKTPGALAQMHVAVSTIPRLAMLLLSLIFILMMIAARGLPA